MQKPFHEKCDGKNWDDLSNKKKIWFIIGIDHQENWKLIQKPAPCWPNSTKQVYE